MGSCAVTTMRLLSLLLLTTRAWWSVADGSYSYIGEQTGAELAKEFNSWINNHGGEQWSKIEVREIPGFRLGTVARQHITPGEPYLKVPWALAISEDSIPNARNGAAFTALRARHQLDVGEYLLLFLLHERFSSGSFWKPYIDILPREYNIPFYWPQSILQHLKGTGMVAAVDEYLQDRKHQFSKMSKVVQTEDLLKSVRAEWGWDLFLWASTVLDSRTIWIEGRKRSFLPMLDMVNNQNHPSKVHRTSFDGRRENTVTHAIWSCTKGSQLFENYGSTNYHNLLYHGFILPVNDYDSARLGLPKAPSAVQRLLKSLGVPATHEVSVTKQLPVALLAEARIRALDAHEVEAALNRETRRNYAKPLDSSNELAAMKMIISACDIQLASAYMSNTIEEDLKILDVKSETHLEDLDPNVKLAIQFRIQQKKIIAAVRDGLKRKTKHDEL